MKGIAPPDVKEARAQLCTRCEHRGTAPLSTIAICKKCGCVLSAKTSLLNAKCPIGKW